MTEQEQIDPQPLRANEIVAKYQWESGDDLYRGGYHDQRSAIVRLVHHALTLERQQSAAQVRERDAQIARLSAQVEQQERANQIIREEGVEARAIIQSRDIEIVKLNRAADALKASVEQQDADFAIEREDATQWRIACGKAEAERDAAQQQIAEKDAHLGRMLSNRYDADVVELRQQIATLTPYKAAFDELYATVQGECPSLLDPCRGGSDVLWNLCAAALQSTRPQEQP